MSFSHPHTPPEAGIPVSLSASFVCAAGDDEAWVRAFFASHGITCAEDGAVLVQCMRRSDHALTYIDEARRLTDEKYILDVSRADDRLTVQLMYGGRRGLFYALCDLSQRLLRGTLCVGRTEAYPLFAVRGYIEGFYGTPWTAQQRLDTLREMAACRMNTYYYAPKDDPYHREKWAQLYPSDALDALRLLVHTAEENCVDFWFCIAPGLDIVYSDARQFDLLVEKCRQVYSVGVRRFGLLLDDIEPELQDETDKARFADLADAHIDLAQRLWDALRDMDDACELTLCPTQYHGRGDEYYISKLGCGIDPRIRLFWTGQNICAQELTVRDAIRFEEHTRHKALYWDNFPVNDAEMAHEMHLGYCYGREADLYRFCTGLIANVMPYCACSRIPLRTIADYLWDPVHYDPLASWGAALQNAVGDDAPCFRVFAEHLLTSCLQTPTSPDMCQAFGQAQRAYRKGDLAAFRSLFADYCARVYACCDLLRANAEQPLFRELRMWIRKFFRMEQTLRLCEDFIRSGDTAYVPQIRLVLRQFLDDPFVMTDFAFQAAVEWLLCSF